MRHIKTSKILATLEYLNNGQISNFEQEQMSLRKI